MLWNLHTACCAVGDDFYLKMFNASMATISAQEALGSSKRSL